MTYIKRIVEEELADKLSASGAVLVKGPKSCGKPKLPNSLQRACWQWIEIHKYLL